MTELIRLFAQIALLRQGPQDVPASGLLLAATVLGYSVVNIAVSLVMPPIAGPWLKHLLVEIAFLLAWYALLLRFVGRPERYPQTATAVFGYQAVLSPLWIASSWLIQRFAEVPAWQFPVSLIGLVLLVWMIVVNSNILKSALEWPMASCVALVILQIIAGQLLIFALFPPPQG